MAIGRCLWDAPKGQELPPRRATVLEVQFRRVRVHTFEMEPDAFLKDTGLH